MRWVVLLGALAGCQDLFKIEHVDRPADAQIDVTADTPTPDSQPGFCWDPTKTGNDDGDAYMDGCDPCPGNADMDPTDGDSDGIPDVCDPEIGHNTIVGFYGLDQLTGWTVSPGAWGTTGSDIVQTDAAQAETLLQLAGTLGDTTWVQVHVQGPDTPGGADTKVGLYLAINGSTSLYDGVTCTAVRHQGSMGTSLLSEYWSQGSQQAAAEAALGQTTDMWISGRISDGSCEAYTGTLYKSAAPFGIQRSSVISLRTSYSMGTFKSITLFSSPI